MLRATTAHTFSTSQLPKVVRTWCVLYISRHSGVYFFDISTSKSAPRPSVFNTLDFEMCFAPATACTFSTSQLPKVVRRWCALHILTWKCASRHNGVHLFISHLASSAPAALASLLFDPPGPQIIGKTQCWATLLPFRAPAPSVF